MGILDYPYLERGPQGDIVDSKLLAISGAKIARNLFGLILAGRHVERH